MTMLWPEKPLGELAERIFVGIAAAATHAYRESGVLLLRNLNIKDGGIDRSDLIYIDPAYEAQHIRKRLQAGDVLTVRTGYAGVSAVLPDDLVGAQCFTALVTRPKVKTLDSRFLAMFLNSPLGEKAFTRSEAGGSQKNVNAGSLEELLIPVPPLEDQRRISKVLSDWDTAIQKTEQLIAAKDRCFKALRERLVASPGGTVAARAMSERAPRRFGDIFAQAKDVAAAGSNLEVLSVTTGGIVRQADYFNKQVASEDKSGYLIVRRGQLVMSGLNFWMGSIDFQSICDAGIVSPAYKVFSVIGDDLNLDYLRHYVRSNEMRKFLAMSSVQGASIVRRNLDMDQLMDSRIGIPDIEKQTSVAIVLNAMERELALLSEQEDSLKKQKRGLMQKLLTGQWRLSEFEKSEATING